MRIAGTKFFSEMLKVTLKTSFFVKIVRKMRFGYYFIRKWLEKIYKNIQTHKIIKIFGERIKNNFIFKFLLECSEIVEMGNLLNLYNFRFIKRLSSVYKNLRYKILNYTKASIFIKLLEELKKELYLLPLKTAGIVLVIAVPINIFFIALLNKEICFFGWIIRGLFLAIGLFGLYSDLKWDDLKKTSNFAKLINLLSDNRIRK